MVLVDTKRFREDRLLPGGVFKDAVDGMAVGRKVSTGWEHSERR